MVPTVDIAIVGTGFAGLGMAIQLKKARIDDFVVLERAADVGGVWRDNTYPGCACDVESHVYSFSFAPYSRWSRMFAPQKEIWSYLRECAERFGIRSHVRFGHELLDATWDPAAAHWRIKTAKGDLNARILVSGMGALAEPAMPRIPGLERFAGKIFHSAHWDHGYDLTGRHVAVIGTGASAIQFVPEIQPNVGQLSLFQRTPPWILPRLDRPLTAAEQRRCATIPLYQKLWRLKLYLTREFYGITFRHPSLMKKAKEIATRHMRRVIKDPELRAKLTPHYEMGCKRVLISNDYYPALAQPNVAVVTDPIAEIRAHSIVTRSGVETPVDAIILGTGFEVTTLPSTNRIHDQNGRSLRAALGPSPKAHLGTTFPGFPNFFMLQGPNTGLGHNSVITIIESQIRLVLDAIRFLRRGDAVALEPTPSALARFVAHVDRKTRGTVWTSGGCSSWYLDETRRNSTLWPSSIRAFRRIARFDARDYAVSQWNDPLTLEEKARRLTLRALMRLPAAMQVRLSGRPPITHGREVLHPQLQLLIALMKKNGQPGLTDLPAEKQRRGMRRESFVYTFGDMPVGEVKDLTIPAPHGGLPARHYAPRGGGRRPLLVFFHGGGFSVGDLETHDAPCRLICRDANVHVLSVDYRLAPEYPFPAAHEDAAAAYEWAWQHAGHIGADPARVGIGGDSAGANLATVVTQARAAAGASLPDLQLLIYPVVDGVTNYESRNAFADGFLLTKRDIERFGERFAPGHDPSDPRLSPLLVPSLPRLSRAIVVTAAFDPLRDEGEAYAAALAAAGTPTELHRMPGLIHGFINLIGISPACRDATAQIATIVKEHWEDA